MASSEKGPDPGKAFLNQEIQSVCVIKRVARNDIFFTETEEEAIQKLALAKKMKGINTAGQSPAPATYGGLPQQSCGVLNPSHTIKETAA